MKKLKMLIRFATVLGPAVVKIFTTYGPQIRDLLASNPQYFDVLKERLTNLGSSKNRGTKKISDRVRVLREQAAYLYSSATNAERATQAAKWRDELDHIAQALPVLGQLDRSERKKLQKKITNQVDVLAADIVRTTLDNDIEEAEVIGEKDDKHE